MWQAFGLIIIEALGDPHFLWGFNIGIAFSLIARFKYLKNKLEIEIKESQRLRESKINDLDFYLKENLNLKNEIGRLNSIVAQKEALKG